MAAAGGGHRARPGRTMQRVCVEGLTGGALCPGCCHLEEWPSRSPLHPVPFLWASLGRLLVTHSSRVSAKTPPLLSPPAHRLLLLLQMQHGGLLIPWVCSALASHCGAEGLLFMWWWWGCLTFQPLSERRQPWWVYIHHLPDCGTYSGALPQFHREERLTNNQSESAS